MLLSPAKSAVFAGKEVFSMIRDQWYVGCASSQLKGNLLSTQLLDQPIVIFRDPNGKAHALLDRCCHRGFPLSKGKIVDGRIQCGFHGWQYDTQGQVARVPSQREDKPVSKSFCVPSFPCEEKDGYVWAWAGSAAPTAVPEMPEIHSGHWMQGSRIIECHYLKALEVTFDAPHVYFLHPTHPATLAAGKFGWGESEMELRMTDRGCVAFGPASSSENEPIPPYAFTMEFTLPGHIRFKAGGNTYMNFYTMPMGGNRCRMDWTITDWAPTEEKLRWAEGGGGIIGEDQFALELSQKSYDREGDAFEKSVEGDTPTLILRRIVKAAEVGPVVLKDMSPQRRVFSIMGAAKYE